MSKTLFTEKQKFRQIWIIAICAIILILFIWGFIQQVIFKIPWGTNPSSDLTLTLFGLIPIIIFLLFFRLTLITEVKDDGVYYKFNFFREKFNIIRKENILSHKIRTYSPIKEYGGWGMKKSFKKGVGVAYNVSGNVGIQFELKNGEKILIGTAFPERFNKAINDIIKKD